jgi:hypothetical protein
VGVAFIAKKFDARNILSKKFVYCKIVFMDAGNFFQHLAELVLRHQMQVSNYFVNFFYSVGPYLKVGFKSFYC